MNSVRSNAFCWGLWFPCQFITVLVFILLSECTVSVSGLIWGESQIFILCQAHRYCLIEYSLAILWHSGFIYLLPIFLFQWRISKFVRKCWDLLQLDVRLHDRRKISGQVEHQSQHRAYRYQNEDASRYCLKCLHSPWGDCWHPWFTFNFKCILTVFMTS